MIDLSGGYVSSFFSDIDFGHQKPTVAIFSGHVRKKRQNTHTLMTQLNLVLQCARVNILGGEFYDSFFAIFAFSASVTLF